MNKENYTYVGKSFQRVDVAEKAYGKAKYTGDMVTESLQTAMLTSTEAHAKIKQLHIDKALTIPGVHAVVTGKDFPYPVGPLLADRPPLAIDKVRYYGEPLAVVIADTSYQAKQAVDCIEVVYEALPVILSSRKAFADDAVLIHDNVAEYKAMVTGVQTVPKTNIANWTKIRKGNVEQGKAKSDITVEEHFSFGPADHAALEPRVAACEISATGDVTMHSATQGPFYVRKMLSDFFNIEAGKIKVMTPYVGGAFGGKGCVQLEFLAYLASRAVGGKKVTIQNTREEDMISSPVHLGLEATVALSATKDGKITAAHYTLYFDGGAYSDMGAGMSKAGAVDCTGPYHIENVHTDAYCMYTNKPYATSFRGFGHPEITFVMERTLDILAAKLAIDPLTIRLINAIRPGHTTPTQTVLNESNIGDITACLEKAKAVLQWDSTPQVRTENNRIISRGISAFWKTSSTPSNATAGVILTFNTDGSMNLNCAAIELGQGTKTVLAQILAEKFQTPLQNIHVTVDVNTQINPHQWKTVASSTTYLAGRAVMAAAEDAIFQLKQVAAQVLQCMPADLSIKNGKIYITDSPAFYIAVKDVAESYKYPSGHAVGGLALGAGSHVVRHLTPLDPATGAGKPGPQWSVGVQCVEIAYNPADYSYQLLKAVTVLDGGTIINPMSATGQMHSGMYLGLSWASRETFQFDHNGTIYNPNFRSYDIMRASEAPAYDVHFVETPLLDGPYGARGIGEYGVIGMAAALANSVSLACESSINQLPITPELVWKKVKEQKDDRI